MNVLDPYKNFEHVYRIYEEISVCIFSGYYEGFLLWYHKRIN